MQIIWSDEAVTDYHQNIDYLLTQWSSEVAIEFIEDVEASIELIKSHPDLYPLTDHQEIRRAVIRKQITLFFRGKGQANSFNPFLEQLSEPREVEALILIM